MSQSYTKRDLILGKWGRWAAVQWRAALLIALAVTAVMAVGVAMITPEFTFYSIMPESSSKVRDLKTITESFPAASAIVVVVESGADSSDPAADVARAIDAIEAELSKSDYADDVAHIFGRLDVEFLRNHGLMLTEASDLRRLTEATRDLGLVGFFRGLNDDLEREYSGSQENLSDDEEMATSQFESLEALLVLLERSAQGEEIDAAEVRSVVDRYLVGDGYMRSRDSTMGILLVEPTFTVNDLTLLMKGVPLIERVVKETAVELGVTAGLTGFTVVAKDEGETAEEGLVTSTMIALVLILALMIVTFRMFSAPLISGVPLLIGVVWTIGGAGFVLGRLNIMTAMYMVALLGLGIDFAIHLLTSYVQERDDGAGFVDAVAMSFTKSGSGILLGGVTTAVAFFALLVGQSEIVRELGVVAGLGVICEFLAMFLIVPGLLGWRNHRAEKRGRPESRLLKRVSSGSTLLPALGRSIERLPLVFAVALLALGAGLASQAFNVEIEGNIMNMEAKGLESVELQDRMVDEFGMAPDFLSVTTSDLDELRSLAARIDQLSSVKTVDSIVAYLPDREQTERRAVELERLATSLRGAPALETIDGDALAEEIDRFWFNVVELADLAYAGSLDRLFVTLNRIAGINADGEKVAETSIDRLPETLTTTLPPSVTNFQEGFSKEFRSSLLGMANPEPITIEMLPQQVRDSYLSRDGNRYLLNAIPTRNPWEVEFRGIYSAQLATVTDQATGMVLAADQMYQIAEVDGVRAAVTALIAIFLLLLLDFRNPIVSLVTLLPLLLSFGSLFGVMAIAGIKFDFINIIAVPLLIGIGIDDAVHINHRYIQEGKGKIATVVAKTGTALLLTSVTTIIGFASFIPSVMRAMRSTGIVLSLAMGFAFLFSVLFHPSILYLLHEKLKIRLEPWRIRR